MTATRDYRICSSKKKKNTHTHGFCQNPSFAPGINATPVQISNTVAAQPPCITPSRFVCSGRTVNSNTTSPGTAEISFKSFLIISLSNPYILFARVRRGIDSEGRGGGFRYIVVCLPADIVLEEGLDSFGTGKTRRNVNPKSIGFGGRHIRCIFRTETSVYVQ